MQAAVCWAHGHDPTAPAPLFPGPPRLRRVNAVSPVSSAAEAEQLQAAEIRLEDQRREALERLEIERNLEPMPEHFRAPWRL